MVFRISDNTFEGYLLKTLFLKLYLKNLLNGIGVFYVWLKKLAGLYWSLLLE
jgi:hypothetical protein